MNDDVLRDAETVGRLYPAVYQRFHISRQTIPGSEVTPRMLGLVRLLADGGPLTLGEIASEFNLSKAAVTELVDRVEAKGYTARMRDERDRRRVFIGLTDSGKELSEARIRVLEEDRLASAMDLMSEGDRKALILGLNALLRADEIQESKAKRT